MFILTVSTILLSLSFLFCVRSLVKRNQTEMLMASENHILEELDMLEEDDSFLLSSELPYYHTYIAYDADTEEVLATNDPFLPLLKETGGKALHFFEKDFFFDGDLDVLYFAKAHRLGDRNIVIAVSENIENDSFTKLFPQLPSALLLMALPVLLLSFLFSLLLTKNTIKPVTKITRAAQTMTTENLDGQLPLTGRGDEIDELSSTFNDLFLRIKADFDRERQFSSDVSHELNTPLTVISGQAGLLLRWGKDNPEQLEKSLNAIKNEAKSMHAIIENLLQISRVESGRIKPQVCEVDVRELLNRVSEEFVAVAPDVKFEVNYQDCPEAALKISTDLEMLHQVITVLVSNSIKFAGGECRVRLSAEPGRDGGLLISESDDGPGIAEETLPHVFERFYRGDEAHTRSAGGSGLGLAIAKTLCDALGAEISAGNCQPHGAQFQLYLPA
jgi:signal transduction histidine kinase